MCWGQGDGSGGILKPLAALLAVTLLLAPGACDRQEDAPQLRLDEATLEEAPEEAEAGPDPAAAAAVELAQVPFQPSGSFPHGEHRRIECGTCHGEPPGHVSHASVSCTDCHGVPAEYATLSVRSRAECMSCHHDPDRSRVCSQCHASPLREALSVPATLRMSVWSRERARDLRFEHESHEGLECGSCHGEPPENAVTRGCASCHEEHHRPEARCGSCHQTTEGEHHGQEVHEGCGGGGCHQDPAVNALPATRPLCLVCHEEQTEHHRGEVCTSCHFLSGFADSGSEAPGGRP